MLSVYRRCSVRVAVSDVCNILEIASVVEVVTVLLLVGVLSLLEFCFGTIGWASRRHV